MSDAPFKRPESVLVVVYTRDGEVLLLKRSDHPDFWQSVTGSLRPGETPPQTARRELAEETGLEGGADRLVDRRQTFTFEILERWRHRFAPGVTHNREHVFSLELDTRRPVRLNPREHSQFDWLARDRAARTVWSWSNRRAILDIVPAPDGGH